MARYVYGASRSYQARMYRAIRRRKGGSKVRTITTSSSARSPKSGNNGWIAGTVGILGGAFCYWLMYLASSAPVYQRPSLTSPAAQQARFEANAETNRWLVERAAKERQLEQAMNADGYYQGSRGGCFVFTSGGNKRYVERSICDGYMSMD